MSSDGTSGQQEPEEPPIRFTDRRKVDRERATAGGDTPPAPGAAAAEGPGAAAEAAPDAASGDVHEPATEGQVPMVEASLLDERTADLQRLQAEYANYRRRAERERLLAGDAAVGRVLSDLLPVIDDLDRARAHGDLEGPLKAVADKLESVTSKLGLVAFGEVGDPFDPTIHEAVQHGESPDVTEPTCTMIMRPGYRHNERLLRAAMVAVSDPAPAAAPATDAPGETAAEPADSD